MAGPAVTAVAFVDEHRCSLAAVRRAIPLVPHDGLLLVVQLSPRVSPWVAMSTSQGLCLPDSREGLVANTFREVAALLAPTGLPWDFSVRAAPAPAPGGTPPGASVTVRHRGGLWHSLSGAARVERFARACHPSPVVIPCGQHPAPSTPRWPPPVPRT